MLENNYIAYLRWFAQLHCSICNDDCLYYKKNLEGWVYNFYTPV